MSQNSRDNTKKKSSTIGKDKRSDEFSLSNSTLSIVILSYNTKEITAECVKSIYDHAPTVAGIDLVIVDNASSDGSAELIEQAFPEVKLIRNNRNRGFAAACNQGIRASIGEYVLLLNSDAKLFDQSLDVLLDFMSRNDDVGICGGLMLDSDGEIQPSCQNYPTYSNLLFSKNWLLKPLKFFSKRFKKNREIPKHISDVPALAGGFLLLRKEALVRVGLFDERFFFYVEDIDLSRRMTEAGWRVVVVPKARVIHLGGASAKSNPFRTYAWHHRSLFLYFMKYYPFLLPLNLLFGFGLLFHLLVSSTINTIFRKSDKPC